MVKDFCKAQELFEEIVGTAPDDYMMWFHRGQSLFGLKSYEEAIECFHQALALKKDHLESANAIAVSYCHTGDYEKAINQFNVTLKLNKRFTPATKGRLVALKGLVKQTKHKVEKNKKRIQELEKKKQMYLNMLKKADEGPQEELKSRLDSLMKVVFETPLEAVRCSNERKEIYEEYLAKIADKKKEIEQKTKELVEKAKELSSRQSQDSEEQKSAVQDLKQLRDELESERLSLKMEKEAVKAAMAEEQQLLQQQQDAFNDKMKSIQKQLDEINSMRESYRESVSEEQQHSYSRLHDTLIFAIEQENHKLVERIVQNHPDIMLERDIRNQSSLHIAAQLGSVEIINILLWAAKTDYVYSELKDMNGQTALDVATKNELDKDTLLLMRVRLEAEIKAASKINAEFAFVAKDLDEQLRKLKEKMLIKYQEKEMPSVQVKRIQELLFRYRDALYPILKYTKAYEGHETIVDEGVGYMESLSIKLDKAKCMRNISTLDHKISQHIKNNMEPFETLRTCLHPQVKPDSHALKVINKHLDSQVLRDICGHTNVTANSLSSLKKRKKAYKNAEKKLEDVLTGFRKESLSLDLQKRLYEIIESICDHVLSISGLSPQRIETIAQIAKQNQ
mmetsp:Transcript_26184/g.29144  ORF Transcript_26184/g.29144 Transcript_26184/m.29144 type:complete len:622 (+) Transcript_26184:66-1931(+)